MADFSRDEIRAIILQDYGKDPCESCNVLEAQPIGGESPCKTCKKRDDFVASFEAGREAGVMSAVQNYALTLEIARQFVSMKPILDRAVATLVKSELVTEEEVWRALTRDSGLQKDFII